MADPIVIWGAGAIGGTLGAHLARAGHEVLLVDTVAVALEIALSGRGVALVNGPFADEDLAAARLVRPMPGSVKCPGAWGAICRTDAKDNPRIHGFMDWLAAAAQPAKT